MNKKCPQSRTTALSLNIYQIILYEIMEPKYLQCNIYELIEDKQFVAWVLKGNKSQEWENFVKENPGMNDKIRKAREIILLLRDSYDVLDENSVIDMWRNVERFNYRHKIKTRSVRFRRALSLAASVLLVLSIGVIGSLYWVNNKENNYQFASKNISEKDDEAKVFLSNGKEVKINEDNSTISVNNNNKLVINNQEITDITDKETEKKGELRMNEVVIPYGNKSEIILADGTKVWLNAGSRLAFPTKFTGKEREVFLEGEACFKVTKNEDQPFIVKASDVEIKVFGTHFNISAYPSDPNIETVLLEGSISLTNKKPLGLGKNEIMLKPNQRAVYEKEHKEVVVTDEANADIYIAWTEGWLQFSKESLHSVFTKLERFYNVEVILPENFPSSELITGKLDLKNSLEEVLVALSDVAKIEYRISNNKIYVDKKINLMNRR